MMLNAACLEEEHLGQDMAQPSALKSKADKVGGRLLGTSRISSHANQADAPTILYPEVLRGESLRFRLL